jgi:hypothetical protein
MESPGKIKTEHEIPGRHGLKSLNRIQKQPIKLGTLMLSGVLPGSHDTLTSRPIDKEMNLLNRIKRGRFEGEGKALRIENAALQKLESEKHKPLLL